MFHRFETKDVNFAHIHQRKIYTDIYLKLFRNFFTQQMKTMNFPQFNYKLTEKTDIFTSKKISVNSNYFRA